MQAGHINITLLSGDGIGPEIVAEAVKVLDAVCEKHHIAVSYERMLMGACAIDATGSPLPQETIESCRRTDATLLGAIGDPKYDNDPSANVRPEQGLLQLRRELGLYANIRPLKIYDSLTRLSVLKPEVLAGVDMVIYRELTGGIYFGDKTKSDDSASDLCIYHRYEIERIARLAFEAALSRKKKLTLVDKANVLSSSQLWRSVVREMSTEYPDIEVDYLFVDNAAMQMILCPAQFDVIVTSNMFGDILSDEASVLGGSIGLLPSSSTGEHGRLYEPVHGSFPQAAGLDIANPIATILSVEMMLRDLGYSDAADDISSAVEVCIEEGRLTRDLSEEGIGCSAVGDHIATLISKSVNQDYGVFM